MHRAVSKHFVSTRSTKTPIPLGSPNGQMVSSGVFSRKERTITMKILLVITAFPIFLTGAIVMSDRWTTYDKIALAALVIVGLIVASKGIANDKA
tara:strand:+ start:410 stop:694 length:285 start_codon:yes stop_codon:yes gene_type:complete